MTWLVVCLMMLAATFCRGATWYVATNGTDGAAPWGASWDFPFATISNAAAKANTNAGGVVLISNGTYQVTAEIILSNNAVCRGFSGDPRDVIIDCSGAACRGFFVTNATVAAMTVTNGAPVNRYGDGGGIYCEASGVVSNCVMAGNLGRFGGGLRVETDAVVSDCVIAGNCAAVRAGGAYITRAYFLRNEVRGNHVGAESPGPAGGGIYVTGSPLVADCRIAQNTTTNSNAGGIYDSGAPSLFVNCHIISNTVTVTGAVANLQGGGVYVNIDSIYSNCVIACNIVESDSSAAYGGGGILIGAWRAAGFYNCLVYGNQSKYGAGVYHGINTKTVWMNSTIAGNTATNTGGGFYFRSGTDTVANCVIYGNQALGVGQTGSNYLYGGAVATAFSNCCLAPVPSGANDGGGNIAANPLFIDAGADDYRPQAGSPCVNSGSNQSWMAGAHDLDGRTRIDRFSRLVDMGCYEYISPGTFFMAQ